MGGGGREWREINGTGKDTIKIMYDNKKYNLISEDKQIGLEHF